MATSEDEYWRMIVEPMRITDDFIGFKSSGEFQLAIEYIISLLKDSFLLLSNGSYTTSILLALLAIEECARAEQGLFTKDGKPLEMDSKGRMIINEKDGKYISLIEFQIAYKLKKSIGEERVDEILKGVCTGKFKNFLKDGIWLKRNQNGLLLPKDSFSMKEANELLLTAIVICEGRLIGIAGEPEHYGESLDYLYKATENLYPYLS